MKSRRGRLGSLLALGLIPLVGCSEATGGKRAIHVPGAPPPIAPYSPAIEVDGTLYVSGQIGIDPETWQLVPGGTEAEARQALDNMKAIVEAAGYSLADVVQAQVFVIDMGEYAAFNAVYATYFRDKPPARALIQAAALPRGARVEVMVVAKRP